MRYRWEIAEQTVWYCCRWLATRHWLPQAQHLPMRWIDLECSTVRLGGAAAGGRCSRNAQRKRSGRIAGSRRSCRLFSVGERNFASPDETAVNRSDRARALPLAMENISPDRLAQAKKDAQTMKEQIQAIHDEKNDQTRTSPLDRPARSGAA